MIKTIKKSMAIILAVLLAFSVSTAAFAVDGVTVKVDTGNMFDDCYFEGYGQKFTAICSDPDAVFTWYYNDIKIGTGKTICLDNKVIINRYNADLMSFDNEFFIYFVAKLADGSEVESEHEVIFFVAEESFASRYNGECGNNLTYSYSDDNNTLTISGTGYMWDYMWYGSDVPEMTNSPFLSLDIDTVIIEDGVESIGDRAFINSRINNLYIPSSVRYIGFRAFDFTELSNVIYDGSEEDWYSLFDIEQIYPGNDSLFYSNVSFLNGKCGDNVTWSLDEETGTLTISGTGAMWDYYGEESTTPYDKDSIKEIVFEDGVTSVGSSAFSSCENLESVDLGSVENLGDCAFAYCTGLKNVEFPDNELEIGWAAFENCAKLDNIEFNNSVYIHGDAFYYCTSLTEIEIPEGSTVGDPDEIEGCIFYECTSLKKAVINGQIRNAQGLFINCRNLTDVEINTPYSLDWETFDGCTSLNLNLDEQDVDFGIAVNPFTSDSMSLNFICGDVCNVIYSGDIPSAPWGARTLNGYAADDGLIYRDESMTELTACPSYTEGDITIPDSVTEISYYAFGNCTNLTSITIPKSVTNIADYAFGGCTELKDVYYNGTWVEWNNISIDETGNEALRNATIHFKETHTHSYTSTVTKEATCTQDGVMTYTCECGGSYTEVIKAEGHKLGSWYVAVEPTTKVCGILRRNCKNCDYCEEMEMGFAETDKVKGVALSSNKENLTLNSETQLTAAVSPETAGNKNIIWSSTDEDVATVDGGLVKAVGVGASVIIAETEEGGYKDFCLVKVAGITASISMTVIDSETNKIYGLAPNLTSLDGYVDVADENLSLEYSSETLGTGTTVNVVADGEVVDSYDVVIFGDTTGDSWYDGMDAMIVRCIANGMLSEDDIGEAAYMAADCNHDGVINDDDVELLEQAGLLLTEVGQDKDKSEQLETSSVYAEYVNLISQTIKDEDETVIPDDPAPVEPDTQKDSVNFFESFVSLIMRIIEMIKSVFDFTMFTK